MKVYAYSGCDTCRKAIKFLDQHKLKYELIPIVDQPPTKAELKRMLQYVSSFKKLFNTSGLQYRELKIGDRLKAGMTEAEALDLLAKNGKLIKRPFVLTDDDGTVGFKEVDWKRFL